MRTDLFAKGGPPWKLLFKDRKGFTYQAIHYEKEPPKEFRFPVVIKKRDDASSFPCVFDLTGCLGNMATYKERV